MTLRSALTVGAVAWVLAVASTAVHASSPPADWAPKIGQVGTLGTPKPTPTPIVRLRNIAAATQRDALDRNDTDKDNLPTGPGGLGPKGRKKSLPTNP